MFVKIRTVAILAAAAIATGAAGAIIETYSVGAGDSTGRIQIDFSNGNGYLIDVAFDGESISGHDAMVLILNEVPTFAYVYTTSEWGVFVEGIGIGGDYEWGVGEGWPDVEDYWHYWVDTGSGWEASTSGNDIRTLVAGDRDGWVFLNSTAPQSVPAPGAVIVLVGLIQRRRRT